jgi:ubiquinone/menaquinone biosynthesis C-methylase UbiE
MSKPSDYGPIAHLYDIYVNVDADVQFLVERASDCPGPVLELMAGTGRVSKGLLQANQDLTCIDISPEMLKVLQSKFGGSAPPPKSICADIRFLPLDCRFGIALIPFNSFSELTSRGDQEQALTEINRVLVEGGRFVCTLHNPAVRAQTLDNKNRLLDTFELVGGNKLELWVQGGLVSGTGLAYSRQTYRHFDSTGRQVDKHIQEIRFSLIGKDEFESMAENAGFDIVNLVGDYQGSEFRDDSPFLIWTLEKSPRG